MNDLSCQPAADTQLPTSDKPTPEQWGREQAALAPPWSNETYQAALACLGLLHREGRGTIET